MPNPIYGPGRSTAQMQTAATFLNAGWYFVGESENGTDNIWMICEGKDYPPIAAGANSVRRIIHSTALSC